MALYDLTEFFRLSAALNYQLSAASTELGRESILTTVLGKRAVSDDERALLADVVDYLMDAYGEKNRKTGPLAVLHPLRATALLARADGPVTFLDLLAELLHDKLEDLPSDQRDLENRFQSLIKRVDPKSEWLLMERIDTLTRQPGDTYYRYIGRLLRRAESTPELVRVKLADRLDNTLDMRIDLRDPLEETDVFVDLFQLLFSSRHPGFAAASPHPPAPPLHGAKRLYELFKNVVALSLARLSPVAEHDPTARFLFDAIAVAGMREAERILLHLFSYHYQEPDRQRELLLETMAYCHAGGIEKVTGVTGTSRLDGLFLERFDAPTPPERRAKLESLYEDKELMSAAAIAFIVIFLNFTSDPSYTVRGVTTEGLGPQDV